MLGAMSNRHTSALSVVFDLDGTLVDSEPNYYEAARRVLARHGAPGFTWEHHTRYIGISTRETLAALRAEYKDRGPGRRTARGPGRRLSGAGTYLD